YDIEQIPPESREYYAGVDFAMGKEKGDYSTIATILKNRDTGRAYVIDVYEGKLHPKEFMEVIIDHAMRYQYDGIEVESQMAQEFFTDYLREGFAAGGYPANTRLGKENREPGKACRIEELKPDMENGTYSFNEYNWN